MLNTVKYLNQHGLQSLIDTYSINVTYNEDCSEMILNYDQLESPKSHPIVKECRSLTLDTKTFEVVGRAFDRFFNYGEVDGVVDVSDGDWLKLEKCDGSLIKIYYSFNHDKWVLTSRGSFADSTMLLFPAITLKERIFRDVGFMADDEDLDDAQYNLDTFGSDILNETKTYIFEYVGFHNPHVQRYTKNELVLTGVRDNESGEYYTYDEMVETVEEFKEFHRDLNIRVCDASLVSDMNDVVEAAKELPNLEEGYVVWNQTTGARYKVKNPAYLQMSKLRNNGIFVPRRIVGLALLGNAGELLSYFPEFEPVFKPHIERVDALLHELHEVWDKSKHIEDKKTFALTIKDCKLKAILFEAKKWKISPKEVMKKMDVERLSEMFL